MPTSANPGFQLSVPIQAIESQRLYQQVATQLAELVHSGHWAPGERLPSERLLAEMLKVSRPTVREAMVALELAGLVEVRTGSGIYVARRPQASSLALRASQDVGPSPFELIEARRLVEGETAALAALHADEDDLLGLREAIDIMGRQMEEGIQRISHDADGDLIFHRRIAAISQNAVLEDIVTQLWAGMRQPLFDTLSMRAKLSNNAVRALKEHNEVLQAIGERAPDAARAAMHRHLDHVREILLEEHLEAEDAGSDPRGGGTR